MTWIYPITSIFEGGNNGKSTFAMMLLAYLCGKADNESSTIVIIDLSTSSTLYASLCNLCPNVSREDFAGYNDCLVLHEPIAGIADEKFVVVINGNPGQITMTWADQVAAVVNTLAEFPGTFDGRKIDHLIFETNLAAAAADATVLRNAETSFDQIEIRYCTIWSAEAIGIEEEYLKIAVQGYNSSNTTWYYIHNPYGGANPPRRKVDETMKKCHQQACSKNVKALEMWDKCGQFVEQNEEQGTSVPGQINWASTYNKFERHRPCNLIPIYRGSKIWRQKSKRFLKCGTVDLPHELPALVEKLSEGMYSEVFENYFRRTFW